MTEHLLRRIEDGVMALTFNRPEKKNAITGEMYGALAEALGSAERDDAVRAVLFLSAGDSFTAGNDLASFAQQSRRRGLGPMVLRMSSGSSGPSPTRESRSSPGSRGRPSA